VATFVVLLFILVVVAATASLVTIAVMKGLQANKPPQLGPPRMQRPPQRPHGPAPWERGPGPEYPQYPALRLSAADRERVMVMLRGGKKIQAIKLYREITGAGLREAKEAVDQMERYQ
jgi:hypothetical protein